MKILLEWLLEFLEQLLWEQTDVPHGSKGVFWVESNLRGVHMGKGLTCVQGMIDSLRVEDCQEIVGD